MKRLKALVCAAALLLLSACSAVSIPESPHEIPIEKLDFSPIEPREWTMENGVRVLYIRDDELPLMNGVVVFRGGQLFDEKGKEGVAAIAGAQMREGATKDLSPDELDELLDNLGAAVESSFGDEWGSVTFSSLSEDFDQVATILAEIVQRPAFDERRLALAKHLMAQGIHRRQDNPGTMASMAFAKLVYGEDSPYSSYVSLDSLRSISRKDLMRFHARFVHPENTLIALAGSVPESEVKELLQRTFGGWRGAGPWKPVAIPEVRGEIRPGVYVLERGFEQASILLGHRGPARLGPEHYELALFNRVFGSGGFSSVLFKEIRSKRGLAYSVWGGFYPGPVSGVLQIESGTRVSQALPTIATILELLKRSRHEPFSPDEVDDAVTGEARSFVFNFETSRQTVGREAWLEVMNYPEDYDQKFLERLSAVSRDEIRAFAEQEIEPDRMVIVIVGDISPEEVADFFGGKREVYRLEFDTEPHVVGAVRAASAG